MANAKIFWRFNSDGATVTATDAAAGFPVSRVQDDILANRYKTGGSVATQRIVFDMGSPANINAIVVDGHDLTSGDSAIKVEANATNVWTSPSLSQTLTYNAEKLKYWWSSYQTYRYWSLVFTKSAASEVRSIGRVVIGQAFTLLENVSVGGFRWGQQDLSETRRTKSGQLYADLNAILRELTINMPFSSQAQMEEIRALCETFGRGKSFYVSIDDDSEPYTGLFYGNIKDQTVQELRSWTDEKRWDMVLSMTAQK